MKKLRIQMSKWFNKLDEQWRLLPLRTQHRYTLLLFAGYTLLSVAVLLKVFYDVIYTDHTIPIEHIENAQKKFLVSPKDSVTNLKRKMYERQQK